MDLCCLWCVEGGRLKGDVAMSAPVHLQREMQPVHASHVKENASQTLHSHARAVDGE